MCLRPETWETGGLENHEESWRKFKLCQIWSNTAATGLSHCVFQIWSNTAATGLFTGHFVRKTSDVEQHRCYGTVSGSIDTSTTDVSKKWASLAGEKPHVDKLGNPISEMARLMRTEKNTCWWNLINAREIWDLRDWRTRESWRILAKIQDTPDLEQHRCNRTAVEDAHVLGVEILM